MYRVSFEFTKKGAIRFISHLDLMRTLTRALRRAEFPLKITEGFSPHPKLSFKRALKLGLESDNEEAAVILKESVGAEEFRNRLQEQLPEGIVVKQARVEVK